MHVDGVTVLAAFVCPEYQMLDAQAKHVPDAMQTVDVAVDVACRAEITIYSARHTAYVTSVCTLAVSLNTGLA